MFSVSRSTNQYAWLLSLNSGDYVWFSAPQGTSGSQFEGTAYTLAARPSITLSSNVKIIDGTGYLNSPYEISLS